MDDKGISALIGILLVLGILVIFTGIIQSRYVPEWNKEIEAEHFNTIYDDMLDIRQAINTTASYDLPKTTVVHVSLDYPNRMFLYNPPGPGAMISTFNDKKINISYDGGTSEVANSCTIRVSENYNYFLTPELIIEHGMIIGKVGQDNFTMENPFMNNNTIDLYLIKCNNNSLGTTSSINIHLFSSQISRKNVTNASIAFTTDYPDLWMTYLKSINVKSNLSGNKITMNYSNSTINIFNTNFDVDLIPAYTGTSTPAPTSTLTPTPTLASTPAPTPTPSPTAISRTYTNNSDFDEGSLNNLNHDVIGDQLQINTPDKTGSNYHFIWVPNSNLGTVSKVDTRNGKEVGRYRVNPKSNGGDPSRTTVDLKGDLWVGTRQAGTVVKIGDYESGHCPDRSGDGVIQTSRDINNDGNITGSELLDWGKDECVLYEVVLIPDDNDIVPGTFIPGTYTGQYDNYSLVAPRGLAIDANNNLWAGTYGTYRYYYIDGATGQINNTKTIDVSSWVHQAYGAIIDNKGMLWSAHLNNHVLRINTSNTADITRYIITNTYGICLDYSGHLFSAGNNKLVKYDINGTNPVFNWTKPARTKRGVVSTLDNNIWVAGYSSSGAYNSVSRYYNNGTLIATISGFNEPSGVAVDGAGKVWVTDIGVHNSSNIYRIDPATNKVDLTKDIIDGGGHYSYSDMTGFIARTITTRIGTWTIRFDSKTANISWGIISWNSSEPAGTSIKVNVRSSDNITANWSIWNNATNGTQLDPKLKGRYLEIETTLQILSGNNTPILYDLTVRSIPES